MESSYCVRRRKRVENTENATVLFLLRKSKNGDLRRSQHKNEYHAAELVYPY